MQKWIIIEGIPVAWKAHRGFGRKSFNPLYKEKQFYQWQIKDQYEGPILEGAVSCDFTFFLPIPKCFSKKKRELIHQKKIFHISRPDRDNLAKFCSDTLIGIVIKDDSQIVSGDINKVYGEKPKTLIYIRTLEEENAT